MEVETFHSWSQAISYGKPVLKTQNEGFNTFAGVFDPGNGRIGPAFLQVPHLAFSSGYHFEKCRHTLVGSNQFRTRFIRQTGPIFG